MLELLMLDNRFVVESARSIVGLSLISTRYSGLKREVYVTTVAEPAA